MTRSAVVRLLMAIAAIGLSPRMAHACPVCFGAGDAPILQGSGVGILALLIVTLAMLSAFALFGLHLIRRARQADQVAAGDVAAPGPLREGLR